MALKRKLNIVLLFVLLSAGGFLWFLGAYLRSIYGLDPPYWLFWTGCWIQLAGALCLIMAPILTIAQWLVRYKRGKAAP